MRTCTRLAVPTSPPQEVGAKAGVKSGDTLEYYTSNTGSAPLVAQILQFNLKQIGIHRQHAPVRACCSDRQGRDAR